MSVRLINLSEGQDLRATNPWFIHFRLFYNCPDWDLKHCAHWWKGKRNHAHVELSALPFVYRTGFVSGVKYVDRWTVRWKREWGVRMTKCCAAVSYRVTLKQCTSTHIDANSHSRNRKTCFRKLAQALTSCLSLTLPATLSPCISVLARK